MTRQEIEIEVRMAARKLSREQRIPPDVAYRMAYRAACRARGAAAGLGISEVKSQLVQSVVQNVVPKNPVAIADTPPGAPAILANVAAAGDDPTVVAARNAVSKWSFLIPIGGLIMSAKSKISAWRSPVSAAMVGSRRR